MVKSWTGNLPIFDNDSSNKSSSSQCNYSNRTSADKYICTNLTSNEIFLLAIVGILTADVYIECNCQIEQVQINIYIDDNTSRLRTSLLIIQVIIVNPPSIYTCNYILTIFWQMRSKIYHNFDDLPG